MVNLKVPQFSTAAPLGATHRFMFVAELPSSPREDARHRVLFRFPTLFAFRGVQPGNSRRSTPRDSVGAEDGIIQVPVQ